MFTKRLERIFLTITIISIAVLANNWYRSYRFDIDPIPETTQKQIIEKKYEIMQTMRDVYGLALDVPIIITDELGGRRYGVTSYNRGKIVIYLNKKVMKESMDYILDDVIAHEYAHALMFKQGLFESDDGHSLRWQEVCRRLGGSRCDRYVDHDDVIMGKMPF